MSALSDVVPVIYGAFLKPQILKINVTETKATCHNCLRSRDKRFKFPYKSNLKCCTFHPYTPNFAIGGVLNAYPDSVGALAIKHKIDQRQFALPIGIVAPFDYQFNFLNKEEEQFGNDEKLLCPYFDRSMESCSIWSYRGVVCTSFFCRSDYGQNGQKFWAVLSDYLSYVEMALAEECLVQTDFSPRDLSDQLFYLNKREFEPSEVIQQSLELEIDKKLWNGYKDKVAFYTKCFELVQKINRSEFKKILGEQGLQLEEEVLSYADRR